MFEDESEIEGEEERECKKNDSGAQACFRDEQSSNVQPRRNINNDE